MFAYDGSIGGTSGLDVELGFGTIVTNDGSTINIQNAEVELFVGTHLDDMFFGAEGYTSYNNIQGFAPGIGQDYVQGDGPDDNVATYVDYTFRDDLGVSLEQGIIVLTDTDEASLADLQQHEYWTGWLPYNEDVLTEELTVTSTNADGYTGDTIVLDHGGSVDVLKNVDYVIGTQFSDIMLGGDDVDVFNPNLGEGNFVDGGDGYDVVVYENTDILENLTINQDFYDEYVDFDSIQISRANHQYEYGLGNMP